MSGYWSTWYELLCPNCSEHNFINAGDESDLTGFDSEACKCYNCKVCFNFEGEIIDENEVMCQMGDNLSKNTKD